MLMCGRVGRLCREIPDTCMQFYGGMGYMNETLVSRVFRDARLTSIGAGADEIMLGVIWKFMDAQAKKRKA